jgi:hypothetical protein
MIGDEPDQEHTIMNLKIESCHTRLGKILLSLIFILSFSPPKN